MNKISIAMLKLHILRTKYWIGVLQSSVRVRLVEKYLYKLIKFSSFYLPLLRKLGLMSLIATRHENLPEK